ncbi:MAG TPA: serine/threonine-protein kinase [Thermoanaerobaculia bacterium]|nr:serine/threonine-protein kinase [Thermoanaerobaculia bacterium]
MSYVGSSIGNIRIESRLGMGGMGEVYLGFDPRLERRVAVKTIRPEKRLSPRLKARFLREARLLSKLGHPSICQVYDLIETPAADFLILEYVQGTTLRKLSDQGEVSCERKLRLGEKIATALAVAHREKIVHRDLKADNIMVTPEGGVKVLDFGIARSVSEPGLRLEPPLPLPDFEDDGDSETHEMSPSGLWGEPATPPVQVDDATRLTRLGTVVGTLQAMSPEQASQGEITEASDLYSFGILLQELFTGAAAYEGMGESELLWQVTRAQTRPIEGLDPDLTRLIQDLESLDPRRRPTAEEAAERLRWILDKPQRVRRRRVRVAAVTGAFVFLLIVLAVVSWLAVRAERARREAVQRRKQAEALIGFMLGDLRQRLEALNRLDALDAAGDRALAYFDGLPESQLSDDELAYRVSAILQIGDVRHTQGRLPDAMAAFRRAQALGHDLVARDPANEKWQAEYLEAYSWIGQVLMDQGKLDEALPVWREGLRLTEAQLRLHPGSRDWQHGLAVAHHNLGTLLEARGDLAGALQAYRESLALARKLSAADPKDFPLQGEIAGTLAFVSNVLERQGDLAGALAERRDYLAIQERLVRAVPGDPARRFDAAVARGFLANLLVTLGRKDDARGLYESGRATLEALSTEDPENTTWQRWLAAFHSALGALAVADGHPAAALDPLGKARRILEALVAKDPTNSDWRLQLGVCRNRMAGALESLEPARARAEARAALEVLSPLLAGQPDEPTRGIIAGAEVTRGRIEAALGAQGEARAAWERALAVLAPCSRPLTHWKVLVPWTEALLALDRLDEARPAVEQLAKMGYRSGDLAKLCREKGLAAAGSFESPLSKSPEL